MKKRNLSEVSDQINSGFLIGFMFEGMQMQLDNGIVEEFSIAEPDTYSYTTTDVGFHLHVNLLNTDIQDLYNELDNVLKRKLLN